MTKTNVKKKKIIIRYINIVEGATIFNENNEFVKVYREKPKLKEKGMVTYKVTIGRL